MAQAKDPVCGMMVDTTTAQWKSEYQGETYYFCAAACEATFRANPGAYVPASSAGAGGREQHEPPFTVSGGVAAPKFGSAGSGGAEYELLPEAHDRKH